MGDRSAPGTYRQRANCNCLSGGWGKCSRGLGGRATQSGPAPHSTPPPSPLNLGTRACSALRHTCAITTRATTRATHPQVPDFINARISGRPAIDVIQDMKWFKEDFTPTVATRGGALIKKWGRSSAASTAVSIADAIRSLVTPTAPGDCFSTAVITDGNPYGISEGLVFSMPCRSKGDGDYEVCDDFIIDDWLRAKIAASEEELVKEKECVGHLIGMTGAACRIGPGEDTMLPGEN